MKKRLAILGSTGSIGRSALDVVAEHSDRIELFGLSAHSNYRLLKEQIDRFSPRGVVLSDSEAHKRFEKEYPEYGNILLSSDDGLQTLARHPEVDIVLNAVTGAAGLKVSMAALEGAKRLALANKESMVVGGDMINELIETAGGELIPVDSEHSAIFQALQAGKPDEVKRLILTASGGPFREYPAERMASITKEEALAHPTWEMGPKITVDSATMMNKGLEVIEAVKLFSIPPERIEVVVHPESIIHSMVEFRDSSIIAQLSSPDMRLPIAYSFFFPDRCVSDFGMADFTDIGHLSFEKPDFRRFPLLEKAFEVARIGGTAPAVFNAANEIAVEAFLAEKIGFQSIAEIVIKSSEKHNAVEFPAYEDIMEADRWGRETAKGMIV